MIGLANDLELVTTNGVIAVLNLEAQIDSLEMQTVSGRLSVTEQANLIDLLSLRGQILGCIADYEQAAALAEQLVHNAPNDGMSFLARAKTRATFHRFTEALTDLDAAERRGADATEVEAEHAAIFQALGHYNQAFAIRQNAAERRPDFATLGALAGLEAEFGKTAEAERLFSESRRCYQGTSPFPIVLLDFQCGLTWLEEGDLQTARIWFEAAQRRVPAYAQAQGHLAEVEAALGEPEAAINRLRPLANSSDDPDYAGVLAGILSETGQIEETCGWRAQAATRYDELMRRHPAAFADHAAEFWLNAGGDAKRALQLAQQNLEIRQTPRAYDLFNQASLASAKN